MVSRLLESGVRPRRSAGGALPSIALHAGIIIFAVYATAKANLPLAPTPTPDIVFTQPAQLASQAPSAPNHRRGRGPGNGVEGPGTLPSGPLSATEVDEPAYPLPGAPLPIYPELLRSSGIVGKVVARFVIDTTGMFIPASFQVLSSDNELFSTAVRRALERTRFKPARVAGTKVKQLVQQQFVFSMTP